MFSFLHMVETLLVYVRPSLSRVEGTGGARQTAFEAIAIVRQIGTWDHHYELRTMSFSENANKAMGCLGMLLTSFSGLGVISMIRPVPLGNREGTTSAALLLHILFTICAVLCYCCLLQFL